VTRNPVLLRTAPLRRETTSSLICRVASHYGMEAKALRSCWHWRNYQPGHEGGAARADAEVLLNAAGRQLLVPHQATFALFTTSRRRSSAACLFRQMM